MMLIFCDLQNIFSMVNFKKKPFDHLHILIFVPKISFSTFFEIFYKSQCTNILGFLYNIK